MSILAQTDFEQSIFISSFKQTLTHFTMSFNGTEGGEITLNDASTMTANYRDANPNEIIAHFFGRDILTELLQQPECVGIRMYYGLNSNGQKELVLVGVDQDENDLIQLVADLSIPCPKACGTQNALNS